MRGDMLIVKELSKRFGAAAVIRDLSLRVNTGERLAILGPNGAGKTTLLRLIAGEIAADAGSIQMDGRDVTRLSADARARAGLGRSFQTTALFDSFTIAENLSVAVAARQGKHFVGRNPPGNCKAAFGTDWLADHCDLHPTSRRVSALDHGTRRRVDLALALAGSPRLLLLDEPAAGLGSSGSLGPLLAALPRDLTIILIEHDLDLAFTLADRIVILDAGRIVFDGRPDGARPVLRAIYDA
ncbi:MAG: ATP-binding cassette domain-containing protein [Paracoccus denitrificans]|uniref:ATP-binding cassette domain-containing protein n=1 Tax=Paracoccus denitrificans TaxID=266 RepID=A0A533I6N2_PARDE|nr:MAG: ATP-binding cassette domain-containing protein [Paracoccus denitrificans]